MTKERDVNAPGGGHNLRNYWVRGEGAAKIRWGTDGSFARCVAQLSSEVKNPQGLCAEYHKAATGEWPAEKGVESSMSEMVEAHGKHRQSDHNPHKGFHVPDISADDSAKLKSLVGKQPEYDDSKTKPTSTRNFPSSEKIRGTGAEEPLDIDRREEPGGPSRRQAIDRMIELERKADSVGISGAESRELRQLRRVYGDLYDPDYDDQRERDEDDDFALIAASKRRNRNDDNDDDDDDNDDKMDEYATGDGDEPWSGVLSVEGIESGDGRLFALGSLDWERPPQPLMYQPANVGGHNASIMVGQIQKITRHGSRIRGEGTVFGSALRSEHGENIRHMMETGGVSVDVDNVKDADVEMVFADDESGDGGNMFAKPETTIFHRGRIRGATLVAFPAFVEAKLAFTGDIVVAHGSHDQGDHGNRYGSQPRPDWSYGDKFEDLTSVLSLPDRVSAVRIRKGDDILGYAVRHPTRGERYVRSDRMGSTPDGMNDIFEAAKMLMADPPQTASACGCDDMDDPLVAASHTITIPNLPKAEWFNEPTDVKLSGALTITDEGRVYGIVAPADTNHRSYAGKKVPRNLDFSRFHKGETIVEGGGRVVTGVVTASCGHAATQNYGTLNNRLEHYDNSCSVLANIRVGYSRQGHIWAAGALNPGADPRQVAQALGCALSLDVQPHPDRPGVREFIAAHLVPVPGFPLARTQASVTYEDGVLAASSVPIVHINEPTYVPDTFTVYTIAKQALAASIGMDYATRKRELALSIEE